MGCAPVIPAGLAPIMTRSLHLAKPPLLMCASQQTPCIEVKRHILSCAGSSTAAYLNIVNAIANDLLQRGAKFSRHLARAACFVCHLRDEAAQALHHLVSLV